MTAQNIKKLNKGFTLIELLVVIGILAILLSITLIAINPARQFSQANDTKRRSDVNAILNAIGQYQTDNKGSLPAGIDGTVKNIAGPADSGKADLCAELVTKYLAALPTDPKSPASGNPVSNCSGAYDTGYTVTASATDNRVTVNAPLVELAPAGSISVTR